MRHYKGYWSFAPMPTATTHIVEAENCEEAVYKLEAWANAHQGCVDSPFDFQVDCLDGYTIICKMTDAYHHTIEDARKYWLRITKLLRDSFGDEVMFEYATDGLFSIFRCIDGGDYDRFSLAEATAIKDMLLQSTVAHLFTQIQIDEVIYNEADA